MITDEQRDAWAEVAEYVARGGPNFQAVRDVAEAVPALLAALRETEAGRDRARRAARAKNEVIESWAHRLAEITSSGHLVAENGDADWGVLWERASDMADRLAKAEAERDALDDRLADLTGLLGFGDGRSEPQADNEEIVRAVEADRIAIQDAEAERDALARRIEAVRALHESYPCGPDAGLECTCDEPYPCATIRALDGEDGS